MTIQWYVSKAYYNTPWYKMFEKELGRKLTAKEKKMVREFREANFGGFDEEFHALDPMRWSRNLLEFFCKLQNNPPTSRKKKKGRKIRPVPKEEK